MPDPDVARSLSDLSIRLFDLGRTAEALPVMQDAVAVYRELAETDDGHRLELARCLSGIVIYLRDLGRPADAVPVLREIVAALRNLNETHDLAICLTDLGESLLELGDPAEALPALREAVTTLRAPAGTDPGRYRPLLAASLSGLGAALTAVHRQAEAMSVTREAETIRRTAAADPGDDRSGPARLLLTRRHSPSPPKQPAESLPVLEQTVAVYRELAENHPDRYRPGLARALSALGSLLAGLWRSNAIPVLREAVTVHQKLSQEDFERYRPERAALLYELGSLLERSARPAEAVPASVRPWPSSRTAGSR